MNWNTVRMKMEHMLTHIGVHFSLDHPAVGMHEESVQQQKREALVFLCSMIRMNYATQM